MFKFDEKAFNESLDKFWQSIENLAAVMSEVFQPVIESLNKAVRKFNTAIGWRRLPYETDAMYAERLVSHDWLDNPDARWEYQKIVWMTPVRIVKDWLRR